MLPDKEVKKKFKKETRKHPDKYFATDALKELGYKRQKCKCGTYFWSTEKSEFCGDPECSGGFRFFENNPATKKMDYIGVWENFSKMFEERGYTPISSYPVAARWRDDTDFVQASIYDFQPWVISGEVEPPANPLVVPQFCLRFNDIDNVGVTMSHNTGFVMIGQHAFVSPEDWNQDKYFRDLHAWFTEGLGIPKEEIILHEDAWAGGGNFGPCMEFFCRGLELANQVYMMYEQTEDGNKELSIKVLDMGMGHERNAWFVKGEGTQYDAAFPTVIEKMLKRTGVEYDKEFMEEYLPHAAFLNVDEVEDVDEAWKKVAKEMNVPVEDLRNKVKPMSALYSVAEHARSLLVALSDGALPGNVKGGYNLRTIYRRARGFIDTYGWDIDLPEVCEWHAEYLKPLFPKLSGHLDEVREILGAELDKYKETKKRNRKIIKKIAEKGVDTEKLLELYDSHGIDPEDVKKQAEEFGKEVKVPENFYALVSERHEQQEQKTQTRKRDKLDIDGSETTILYYDHYDLVKFDAVVEEVKDNYVVLEETAFYPTSGGQEHDTGTINGYEVIDVFKQGKTVIHKLMNKPDFKRGDVVKGEIDWERRLQLAQHHTATHIVGGVARKMLGEHVWQAGASKTEDKSRLDITHYENLTDKETQEIEDRANEIISQNVPVLKNFFSRDVAQKEYGFKIYQGGAVPGKNIRIVEIEGLDVQACGGTHLDTTGDAGSIKIIKSTKVQDGIVRLEYVAGQAAKNMLKKERAIIKDAAAILDCAPNQVPGRAKELFRKWKKSKKAVKKNRDIDPEELELVSEEVYKGDLVAETADILRTQPEHIVKTVKRFKKELDSNKDLI